MIDPATLIGALPRSTDPAAWLALPRGLPLWAAFGVTGLGLVAALFGARPNVFRLLLAPLAASAGWWGAHLAIARWHPPGDAQLLAALGAALAGGIAVAAPMAVVALGVGVAFGTLGAEVAGRDAWVGAIPGFALGFGVGVWAERPLSVGTSVVLGAALLAFGGLALAARTPAGALAAKAPWTVAAVAVALAAGGALFQWRHPPRRQARDEREAQQLRDRERARKSLERQRHFREVSRRGG